jgi:hypothetical protein
MLIFFFLALSPLFCLSLLSPEQNFAYSTLEGITVAQAPLMEPAALSLIATSSAYAYYILPDTLSAFSCDQLRTLEPARGYMIPESQNEFAVRALVCPGSITTTHQPTSGHPHAGYVRRGEKGRERGRRKGRERGKEGERKRRERGRIFLNINFKLILEFRLSGGQKAGVAFGVLIGFALIAGMSFFFFSILQINLFLFIYF